MVKGLKSKLIYQDIHILTIKGLIQTHTIELKGLIHIYTIKGLIETYTTELKGLIHIYTMKLKLEQLNSVEWITV